MGGGGAFQVEETAGPTALQQGMRWDIPNKKDRMGVTTGQQTSGLMWVRARGSVSSGRGVNFTAGGWKFTGVFE